MFVSLPSRKKAALRWATPLLFAALWLAFLWSVTRPQDAHSNLLMDWGALSDGLDTTQTWASALRDGSALRLFTALFLLGGAVSNLAAVLAIGMPDRVIIGASGAVSAVIGAYLALFPNAKLGVVLPLGLFLQFVKAPASLLIGIWALLQVIFAYIGPAFGAVAWSAHIAGFLFGVVFALFVRAAIARRLRKRQGY